MDASLDHLNRRLGSLALCAIHQRTIRLTCPACQHARLLEAVTLWWMFDRRGWDDDLPRALRRFYCARCWRRRHVAERPRFAIATVPPEGPQFAYPPEWEWKRLISRYRS